MPTRTEKTAADRHKLALQWLFKPIGASLGGRHITRPAWQPLTAALIAVLSIFIWTLFFHQSALDQGLLALNAAYAEGGPVEARISGFAYAIYPAERGGDSTSYKQDVRDEAAQAITSATAGKKNKSPREYQALGKLYLTDMNFNKAANCFNLVLKQEDRNAKLYNDLAVTLMASEKAKKPREATGENYAQASE